MFLVHYAKCVKVRHYIALFSCQFDSCWIHILGDDILLDLGYPYYQRQNRAPFNYRRYFNDDEEDDSMSVERESSAPSWTDSDLIRDSSSEDAERGRWRIREQPDEGGGR